LKKNLIFLIKTVPWPATKDFKAPGEALQLSERTFSRIGSGICATTGKNEPIKCDSPLGFAWLSRLLEFDPVALFLSSYTGSATFPRPLFDPAICPVIIGLYIP